MGLALFDSNIVIDALNGYTQAIEEISYFSDIAISAVAWVEVMARPIAGSACSAPNRKQDFRGANIRLPYELQDGRVVNVALAPTAS
jgi:hypothetical protein